MIIFTGTNKTGGHGSELYKFYLKASPTIDWNSCCECCPKSKIVKRNLIAYRQQLLIVAVIGWRRFLNYVDGNFVFI